MNSQKLKAATAQVEGASDIPPETKARLSATLNEAREAIPDTFVYRIVVLSLGLVAMLTVVGAIVLSGMDSKGGAHKLPEGVIALASAAVGAMAGLLAPSPRGG